MRRLELLINQVRPQTENEDVTDTTGIQDEEFVQYANDAQDLLQSSISMFFPDVFQAEKIVQATSGLERYPMPSDLYLGTRIDLLEYSPDRSDIGYYVVRKGNKKERVSGLRSVPSFYIRQSNSFLLEPTPQQNGFLRITYQQSLPRLDIRRGQVASVSMSGSQITSLVLDTTQSIDDVHLIEADYITIVDKDGLIKMKNVPVSAVSTTNGAVTVIPGFTFQSGESISPGDYVVRGRCSTTHCQMADIAEGFLIKYMAWKILKRDSSNDAAEQESEMKESLQLIVDSYRDPDGDVNLIPIINGEFLTPEG